MKKFRPLFRSPLGGAKGRPGFALVVALAAIVLMTVLVLAFFSRASLNRQVAFSSANQTKAEMMARFALDVISGEIRQEIVDFSAVTNGIFFPTNSINMLPGKTGVAGADTNVGAFTIAKVAGDGVAVNPGTSGTPWGSSVRVDTSSRNGRTQSRWFSAGPRLGSADLPTWAYLSRGSGVTTNLAITAARDPASPDYVTGRFTYTVYETGGLLNANVAGYPPALFPAGDARAAAKGSLAYADLTALGISTAQIQALTDWRNARTGTNAADFDQWASGVVGTNTANSEALQGAASGHTRTVIGDNAFLSRRDLLRYLDTQGISTNAAGALSHTFRGINAPSWGPSNVSDANVDYGDIADEPTSINRVIPAVRAYNGTMREYADDGTFEEITVTSADPLVRERFSLAKLAWLGHNGRNDAAFHSSLTPAQKDRAILDCFGLAWFNGSGGTSSDARWEYDHGNPNDIMILDEIRAEGRAPDFFELLKAGVLSKSLGGEPGMMTLNPLVGDAMNDEDGPIGADFEDFSADQDRHLLQIGANIIDQADADNYPTAIHMDLTPLYAGSEREFYNTVFGVENLPLLHRIAFISSLAANSPDDSPSPVGNWLQPELWNPHEKSTAATPAHPETPVSLRFIAYGTGRVQNVDLNPDVYIGEIFNFGTDFRNPSVLGTVNFRNPSPFSTTPRNLFDKPVLITKGLNNAANYSDPAFPVPSDSNNQYPADRDLGGANYFFGINIGDFPHVPAPYPAPRLISNLLIPVGSPMTFVLEYYDGSTWRPYSAITRVTGVVANSGVGRRGTSNSQSFSGHADPRTQRFSGVTSRPGAGNNPGWTAETTMRPNGDAALMLGLTGRAGVRGPRPRGGSGFEYSPFANGGQLFYPLDSWAENVTGNARGNSGNNSYYSDPDGVVRPGDSWRADYTTGDGVPLFHYDKSPESKDRRRPVILNRPFRSVGELSYVFRDQPFKTLDFWSERSADAGLLDLFTVSASAGGRTAAQVNLNTATPAVLTALLSGAGKQAMMTNQANPIDLATAERVANVVKSAGPQTVRSSLGDTLAEGMFSALTTNSTGIEFRNKSFGEAPARVLAEVSTTRAWNFLVDVVAQSGRLARNASGLQDFVVEGECRYWMHLAIDRYTGEILDQQLEPVLE